VIAINNLVPRGFGANHNTAFNLCKTEFFCVLNPDIIFSEDPFNVLIGDLKQNHKLGLVAPLVKNKLGNVEDSARPFLSLSSLLRRNLFSENGAHFIPEGGKIVSPPWLAGMFMLYRSNVYSALHGFDEGYFLYVEDADICTRAWLGGYYLALDPRVSVIHDARRNSLKKWNHFRWHLCGVMRYFYKFTFRLPVINSERK
jgi:GT2 family glycosyltransferase